MAKHTSTVEVTLAVLNTERAYKERQLEAGFCEESGGVAR
jgi:hypothetical protein